MEDWYPPKMKAAERLPWYATHFNYVEVNSTFYAVPSRSSVKNWSDITPDGFTFDIKLHKLLSRHSTKLAELPVDLRSMASATKDRIDLTPKLEQAVAAQVLEATKPLQTAGKLGAYLLQLTPSFSPKHNKLEELEPQLEVFHGYKFGLELRNRNWMDGDISNDVLNFCEHHEIAIVMVDAPDSNNFMVMPDFTAVTSRLAYLRLHGRDELAFTTGKTVAERFNYEYSEDELKAVAEKVETVAADADEVHVVFNNNARDLAPKAATLFNEILQEMRLVPKQ